MKNTLACIILYKPNLSILNTINVLIHSAFDVAVFDNSPDESASILANIDLDSVHYMTCGSNVGLGKAIKQIENFAFLNEFNHLFLLDQDTLITNASIHFVDSFIKDNSLELTTYTSIQFSGKAVENSSKIEKAFLTINSGSLIFVQNSIAIGGHNESYFVDCVDYEFNIRSHVNGYKTGIVFNTVEFDHVTGQDDTTLSIFGLKLLLRNYPWSRVKDSLGAHLRLLKFCMNTKLITYFMIIFKSLFMYSFFRILSFILLRR